MRLKVKNKRISGVYKITNPSGDSYIGQSFDVVRRFRNHKKFICSNHHLSKSIKEFGVENHTFEILEECLPINLITRERYYINFYKEKITLFNLTVRQDLQLSKIWGSGRRCYTIMCHPCRITEAREYIKKLKPKKFVPYFISGGCKGEICTVCGKDATNKLGEEIPFDDPDKMRHNLTAYVCREHFTMIVGGGL